jgi:hypothetical protein
MTALKIALLYSVHKESYPLKQTSCLVSSDDTKYAAGRPFWILLFTGILLLFYTNLNVVFSHSKCGNTGISTFSSTDYTVLFF